MLLSLRYLGCEKKVVMAIFRIVADSVRLWTRRHLYSIVHQPHKVDSCYMYPARLWRSENRKKSKAWLLLLKNMVRERNT